MPGLLLIPILAYVSLHIYLGSTAPLWFLVFIEFPLILTYLEIKISPPGRLALYLKISRIFAFTTLIIGFLLFILLLPESLYQAWLLLLDAGRASGMISFAFTYAGGLVSSIGCASLMRWRNKGQAVVNLLLLCLMVLLILHPRIIVFSVFLILLILKLILIHKVCSRFVLILSLCITLIPALIFAFLIPVLSEDPRGSRAVDHFSMGVQSTVSSMFPELPLLFQIPGYGYSYDYVRKSGDRPVLTSNIIFTVEAEPGTVLYLRSDVFYSYMKGFWSSEYPGTGEIESDLSDKNNYRIIQLTIETDIYTRILHNSWTSYYKMDNQLFKLDSQGSFKSPSGLPLIKGDQIFIYDSPPNAPIPDEESLTRQLKRSVLLPETMKKALMELALSLEGESEKQSLYNIKNYLRQGYKYTLDTRSSENMVLDFLNESKVGYCVHFSTSAALLARSLGIPVRMAEGFLVQVPEMEDGEIYYAGSSYGVTGYSAHQWPEIYIKDRGWIPWEVTPPFEALGDSMTLENNSFDEFTREQLQQIGVLENNGNDLKEESEPFRHFYIIFTLLAAMLMFVLSLIGLKVFRDSKLTPLLNGKIRILEKKFSIPPPSSTGWIKWFDSLQGLSSLESGAKDRCLVLILKHYYQKEQLDNNEKKELLKLIKEL